MADIKFSEFQKATISKDSDEIAILQDGVNKMIPSPVLESKIINKTVSRVIEQGGASLNVINLKGVVTTYADLALITPTPELNDAYQVEADGLVYVYTESGFQADGEGIAVQPAPNGVVEEGNTQAVSGGNVYDAINGITTITPINLSTPSPEQNGIFQPTEIGIYGNFGNLELTQSELESNIVYFYYLDGIFTKQTKGVLTVDEVTAEGLNAVNGKAVFDYTNQTINTIADLRLFNGKEGQIITLLGYYEAGDKEPLNYKWTSEQGIDDGGSVINTEVGSWIAIFGAEVNLSDFGANQNKNSNHIEFIKCRDYCADYGKSMYIGSGVYNFSESINLAKENLKIKGNGSNTILQFNNSGKGLSLDAFSGADSNTLFVQGMEISDLLVSGNENTTEIIYTRGLARCEFSNIWTINGSPAVDGYGISIEGTQLCTFRFCGCSTDKYQMESIPYAGLALNTGARAGVTVGNTSNNTFLSCYFEGLQIGILGINADQNFFIGGSPESCSIYGVTLSQNCRYNTFIGVGFENKSTSFDLIDNGKYNKYINCYSSVKIKFEENSVGCSWENGYNNAIYIANGAVNIGVKNITYGYWGDNTFIDLGSNSDITNIYNHETENFIENDINNIDSIKLKPVTDIDIPNSLDSISGSVKFGIVLESTGDYPISGTVIKVDRYGDYDSSSSTGSYILYSTQTSNNDLFFRKKIASNGTPSDWSDLTEFTFKDDYASLSIHGLVKQSVNTTNISTPDATDLATALTLVNELKAKLNAKLTADRNSGQQAT